MSRLTNAQVRAAREQAVIRTNEHRLRILKIDIGGRYKRKEISLSEAAGLLRAAGCFEAEIHDSLI